MAEIDTDDRASDPASLPRGNPLRIGRGLAVAIPSILLAFFIIAQKTQLRWGVPLAAVFVAISALGLLDLLGTFDDSEEGVQSSVKVSALVAPLGLGAFGFIGTWVLLTLGVSGVLGPTLLAVLVPAQFLLFVVGVYKVLERFGVYGETPTPIHKRHGFWLVVITTLILLPMLGSHSLTDPWETHYGEVSREILARNDWISLWWAQEEWFWSKPILDFWLQSLAMSALGVRYLSGGMLSAFGEGREPWPEWAVRFPIFLLTLTAGYLLYKAVAAVFGRRAGFLGGLVLATMPQWFMVAHQTMTDMPFVASMAASMACALLGLHSNEETTVRSVELVLGKTRLRFTAVHVVLFAVMVCALPQILYLFSRNIEFHGLVPRIHSDTFQAGSPGNCDLPGNDPCKPFVPSLSGLQPALQAVLWAQALGLFLYTNWGERRVGRLWFIAAWLFAALSTMAKGPAGVGLVVLCALAYIVVSGRAKHMLRMEVTSGILVLLCVAMPWFVAMYARHGQAFTDRLIFHDMFKRAFTHVHDTNEGDDTSFRYYVWQLGYAMFPWSGLSGLGLVLWARRREAPESVESELDDGLKASRARADAAVFLATWFGLSFALFSAMLTKFHHYILPAVPPAAMLTGILLDDILRKSDKVASERDRFSQMLVGAAAIVAALVVLVVGLDLVEVREGLPNQARLLQLFTYNYKRPWPPSLDFRTTLWGFVLGAAVLTLFIMVFRVRKYAVYALCALAVLFAAWTLDVYFVKTSPHWGQRELIAEYVRQNSRVAGPIIGYQMNWKGENFYTGNKIPAFVTSGKKFQDYVLELKKKGHKTFYFVTEPHRTGTLNTELGMPIHFDKLTTPELNNKFVLVRARFD